MISVIIPTYNREKLLRRSLESVLKQSYGDIEIIIVDDCSTDSTEEYIQSIDDNRIRYIHLNERGGGAHAKNIGIELASGEYIAFQDSDDLWYENKLEKQLSFLQTTDSDIVFCSFRRFINNAFHDNVPSDEIKEGTIPYELMLKESIMSTQTILGKSECFIDEKFNEKHARLDDWDLAIRLSKKYKVTFQKEILVDVYVQEDSVSSNPFLLFDEMYRIYETYQKEFSNDILDHSISVFMTSYKTLEAKYKYLKYNYQQIVNSTTWKTTKPIREILDRVRKKTSGI